MRRAEQFDLRAKAEALVLVAWLLLVLRGALEFISTVARLLLLTAGEVSAALAAAETFCRELSADKKAEAARSDSDALDGLCTAVAISLRNATRPSLFKAQGGAPEVKQ